MEQSWRQKEFERLGINEPVVMSSRDVAKKRKKKIEPIYISTKPENKKPRTADFKNNWPGNINGPTSKAVNSGNKGLYSIELVAKLCERMCNGEAPTEVCKDPTMPAYSTIMKWYADDDPKYDTFRMMFDQASKIMMFYHADQLLVISDDSRNDYIERYNALTKQNERVFDPENVQRSRLRVDTRKFLLSKLMPHIYGEKVDVSVGGRDGKPIAVAAITMSVEEAERAYMDMINGTVTKQLKKD